MNETKLKRLIKKMMDSIFLDAMTPEFKAANAELLKAIKMNDKSGAVPHADLEAVNKAMKENNADKVGAALKKVQLQFSKAEKKLDDDVKSIQAKLETTKKTAETAKASLKQKKALASVFDKMKTLVSGLSNNPKNASNPGDRDEWFESLMYQASKGYSEAVGDAVDTDILKDIALVKTIGTNGEIYRAEAMMKSMADNNKVLKKVLVRPLNFIKKVKSDSDAIANDNYFGFNMNTAKECSSKSALYSAAKIIVNEPDVR